MVDAAASISTPRCWKEAQHRSQALSKRPPIIHSSVANRLRLVLNAAYLYSPVIPHGSRPIPLRPQTIRSENVFLAELDALSSKFSSVTHRAGSRVPLGERRRGP